VNASFGSEKKREEAVKDSTRSGSEEERKEAKPVHQEGFRAKNRKKRFRPPN